MKNNFIRIIGCAELVAFGGFSAKAEIAALKLGVLKCGTVNWALDVLKQHKLDAKHGLDVEVIGFAGKQASSVALQGGQINHSTQPQRLGQDIFSGDWAVQPDGVIALTRTVDGRTCHLRFVLDLHEPDFQFIRETPVTPAASQWMEDQKQHLFRHASVAR